MRYDDEWFMGARRTLISPARWGADQPRWRVPAALRGARYEGDVPKATEGALRFMAPRHRDATRAHMQLYRACVESTGVLQADRVTQSAVQIEWLWYTSPFKGFYRDHLAHVMKVAAIGLHLLESADSPLAPSSGQSFACEAARNLAGWPKESELLRLAARRCGICDADLRRADFWKAALHEVVRIGGLMHDMSYPDMMADKVRRAADPDDRRAAEIARLKVAEHAHRLWASVFNGGHLPAPGGLTGRDARVAEIAYRVSHAPRAAVKLLELAAEAERHWSMTPFERFVVEWAARAVALHDLDMLHDCGQCGSHGASTCKQAKKWSEDWPHTSDRQAGPRPSIRGDPGSFLLALADQLQEFGRMHYKLDADDTDDTDDPSTARLSIRYPCEAVEISRTSPDELQIQILLGTVAPFDASPSERQTITGSKRDDVSPHVFGAGSGWLDGGSFTFHLNVQPEP